MTKGLWIKTGATTWSQVSENNSSNFSIQEELDVWQKTELVYVKTGATTWSPVWNRIPPTPIIIGYFAEERQITIYWESGTDDLVPFDFDKWQFTTNNGASWGNDSTNEFLREKILTGLSEGSSYNIGVRCVDKLGNTAQAIQLMYTDNIPPEAPYAISPDAISQTSITVSWEIDLVPADFLRWRLSSNGGSTWSNSTNSALRSYSFNSLTAGELYNIVVRIEDTGGNTAEDSASFYTFAPTPAAPTLTGGRDGWSTSNYAVYQSDIDAGIGSLDDVTRNISCSVTYNGKANNQYCYYELLSSADVSLETSDNFDLVTTSTVLTYDFVGLARNTTYKVRLVSVDMEDNEIFGPTTSLKTLEYSSQAIYDIRQAFYDTWTQFGYNAPISASSQYSTYVAENVGDDTSSTTWISGSFTSAGSSGSSALPWIQGEHFGGVEGQPGGTYYTEIGRIRIRSGYAQSYSLHIGLVNSSGTVVWQGTGTIQGLKYWATSTYNDTGAYDEFNFVNLTQNSGRKYYVRLYIWDMDRITAAGTLLSGYRASIRDIQILEREWYPETYQSDTGYY